MLDSSLNKSKCILACQVHRLRPRPLTSVKSMSRRRFL
jgi:hypothetical protein